MYTNLYHRAGLDDSYRDADDNDSDFDSDLDTCAAVAETDVEGDDDGDGSDSDSDSDEEGGSGGRVIVVEDVGELLSIYPHLGPKSLLYPFLFHPL